MNKEVEKQLKEIFYHVADAVDGGEAVPHHLREAYLKAFDCKAFRDFYGQEVCLNSKAKL